MKYAKRAKQRSSALMKSGPRHALILVDLPIIRRLDSVCEDRLNFFKSTIKANKASSRLPITSRTSRSNQ